MCHIANCFKRGRILVAAVSDLVARDAEGLRGQLVDVAEFDRSAGTGVVHRDRSAVEMAALHVANLHQDGDLSFDKMRGQSATMSTSIGLFSLSGQVCVGHPPSSVSE